MRHELTRQVGDRQQGLVGGAHRAEVDRPAVTDAGHDDRLHRVEAHAHHQRGSDCHRHTKAAHALQEGDEHPAHQQPLQGAVFGE